MAEDQVPADIDLPIAVRRQRRSNASADDTDSTSGVNDPKPLKTPSKSRSKKRVRFSEPGFSTNTTGLTPFIQRTSLEGSSKRRHSTPLLSTYPYPPVQNLQFVPLRQVIDERSKRRLRRTGLSEEMNAIESDRRGMKKLEKEVVQKDEALKALRYELEEMKNKVVQDKDQERSQVSEIEEELRRLKASMERQSADLENQSMEWEGVRDSLATAARGDDDGDTIPNYHDPEPDMPVASSFTSNVDANALGASTSSRYTDPSIDTDMLAMVLDLESAKHEKRVLFKEFQHQLPSNDANSLNFADAPTQETSSSPGPSSRPLRSPPPDFLHNLSRSLRTTQSRAEEAELALHTLSIELKALGFPGTDSEAIIEEIRAQFRAARLELERTVPGETVSGFENANVLKELVQKLKSLASRVKDREAELRSMHEQRRALQGNFDHSLVNLGKAGEKIRDLEQAVDQSAEDMIELRMKLQRLEKEGEEKDRNVGSLISALDKYRSEVHRLEQLVTGLEANDPTKLQEARDEVRIEMDQVVSDLECKVTAEEKGRRAAESEAVARLQRIEELEEDAEQSARDLQLQMQTLAAQQEDEANTNSQQLGALNTRISNLTTALDSANAEVKKLKTVKNKLEERLEAEMEQAQSAVEAMEAAMVKSVVKANESKKSYIRKAKIRHANSQIADEEQDAGFSSEAGSSSAPMTPVSLVRFVDVDVGRGSEGKRERRAKRNAQRDSGIGMDSLEEVEDESQADVEDSGMELEA
ncbi:MAG: hypothetical protein Q9160_002592 [Pyrenula sp. 1 TL-2023]